MEVENVRDPDLNLNPCVQMHSSRSESGVMCVCVRACRRAPTGGDAAAPLGVGVRLHPEPPLRQVQEQPSDQQGALVSTAPTLHDLDLDLYIYSFHQDLHPLYMF